MIPNLVNTVKGYITYEEETLSKLIELRNQATGKLYDIDLQREISADISKITAFAENYPELKANAQFAILQNQLSETERDIAQARKYYNGAVREYNILVKSFPSKAVASMNGFYELPYYETAEEEKENIKAEF